MLIDPDLSTRRDGKRLKNINLTENEWQEMSKLIIILEDFAGATEYLGRSKYATISLMYSVLAMIKQKILPDNDSNVEDIDLTNSDTAFDDDQKMNLFLNNLNGEKLILICRKIALILKNVLKQHFTDQ